MPFSLSRRQFVRLTAGTLGAAVLGDGFLIEPNVIDVTRHDVPVPGLPHELEGFRIACVTDVHLHDGIHHPARATLDQLARERPHLVALIGDICNYRTDLEDLVPFARRARGSVATVATLGNWEHDAGIDRGTAEKAYGMAGVELLFNSSTRVRVGNATLNVVGIDDPVMGRPDVVTAARGLDGREPCVWLVHAPAYVDRVAPGSVPRPTAIISGHTHGGQVRLPLYTPYTPYGSGRFVAGWYHDTLAPLYVSRGIGTVSIPVRLFCPPELPIFTLRRSSEQGAGSRS
jgi:predicted MPP superfamily phosphohydrolase